jgi:hypothetical protein
MSRTGLVVAVIAVVCYTTAFFVAAHEQQLSDRRVTRLIQEHMEDCASDRDHELEDRSDAVHEKLQELEKGIDEIRSRVPCEHQCPPIHSWPEPPSWGVPMFTNGFYGFYYSQSMLDVDCNGGALYNNGQRTD